MNEKASQTAIQTKKNITDAFWQLYKKGGISKVSVTSICNMAGYNRSTFYMYFQDIYEVLDEIESQIVTPEEFNSVILSNLFKHQRNKEKSIGMIIDLYEANSDYFPVLLGDNGDPAFRQKLVKKLAPSIAALLNLPLKNNKRITYIMEYQSSAVIAVITKWYQSNKNIPKEELITLLLDITNHGVQAELTKYMP